MNKLALPLVAGLAVAASLFLLAGCGSGGGTSPSMSISPPLVVTTPSPSPTPTPSPSPTPDGPVSATGRYQDLVFTVTAPKRVYAHGEVVPLTFTVQNTGTTDAFSDYVFHRYLFDGEVKTPDGQTFLSTLVNRAGGGGNLTSGRIVYQAGQTITYQTEWYQTGTQSLAMPGMYRVRAYMTVDNLNGNPVSVYTLGTDFLDIVVQ